MKSRAAGWASCFARAKFRWIASSLSKLGGALAREGEDAAASNALNEAAALDREAALGEDHHAMTMVPPPIAR